MKALSRVWALSLTIVLIHLWYIHYRTIWIHSSQLIPRRLQRQPVKYNTSSQPWLFRKQNKTFHHQNNTWRNKCNDSRRREITFLLSSQAENQISVMTATQRTTQALFLWETPLHMGQTEWSWVFLPHVSVPPCSPACWQGYMWDRVTRSFTRAPQPGDIRHLWAVSLPGCLLPILLLWNTTHLCSHTTPTSPLPSSWVNPLRIHNILSLLL